MEDKKYFVIGLRRYKTAEEFKNIVLGHNQRERHYVRNHKNIDWSRTHKNIVLQKSKFKSLKELLEFTKSNLGEGKRNLKKGAAWGFEIVVDCSKMENWSEEDYVAYLKNAYEWFKRRFSDLMLLNAVIHLDEGKPHLHLTFSYFSPTHRMWFQRKLKEKKLDRLPQLLKNFEKEVGSRYGLQRGDGKKIKQLKKELMKEIKTIKKEDYGIKVFGFKFFKKVKKYKVLSPKTAVDIINKYSKSLLEEIDKRDLQDKLAREMQENKRLQKQIKEMEQERQKFLKAVSKIKQLEQQLAEQKQVNKQLAVELVETKAKLSKTSQQAKKIIQKQIQQKYNIHI